MKKYLIIGLMLMTACTCLWGQGEWYCFEVRSKTPHTETASGSLRFRTFVDMMSTSFIAISEYGSNDIYKISCYDQQGYELFSSYFDYSSFSTSLNNLFKISADEKRYIYGSGDFSFFLLFSSNSFSNDYNYEAVCSKKLYDVCHTAGTVELGISNGSGSSTETREGVKFVIYPSSKQYIIFRSDAKNRIMLKSEYDRIEKQKQEARLLEEKKREEARLLEEKRKAEEKKKEDTFQQHVREAGNYFEQKAYDMAKAAYKSALSVKPDKEPEIAPKIKEIEEMQQFLEERKRLVYDYRKMMPAAYDNLNAQIAERLKTELLDSRFTDDAEIVITCEIDTEGLSASSFDASVADPGLSAILRQISRSVRMEQPSMKGYTVAAKAEFVYDVSGEQSIIKVKKNRTGMYSSSRKYDAYKPYVEDVMKSAPDGEFSWQFNRVFINDEPYVTDRLLKYKGAGGPGHAVKSIFIPGWGDRYVTAGAKSGVRKALLTYGFIGAGVGCKFLSDSEYKKHHALTGQSVIDDTHYNRAKVFDQAFYLCVGTGAVIWLSDIIWVWRTGARNQRVQNAFKQSHLGFYYQPDYDATVLTYTVNF
jgi:hypothetical protein